METPGEVLRSKSWFERLYKGAVIVKGIDGVIELASGITLLISPPLLHTILSAILGEVNEHHNGVFVFLAENIARVDVELVKSGLIFLTLFLIIHGIVKLALVYCLLKEIVKAYPVALLILIFFLVYQVYVLIVTPDILMVVFTLLDIAIVWIVWNEYQQLKSKKMV